MFTLGKNKIVVIFTCEEKGQNIAHFTWKILACTCFLPVLLVRFRRGVFEAASSCSSPCFLLN